MRDLVSNQSTIYYSMYAGKQSIRNSAGLKTGQSKQLYTNPKEAKICVSTPTGQNTDNPFGNFSDYDKVMTTTDKTFFADEYSVLWIDVVPTIEEDGSTETDYDYRVVKVAPWKNQIAYAIKKIPANIDDSDYLKNLLEIGAITQEEYDYYIDAIGA